MYRLNIGKALSRMACLADGAKLALMNLGFGVARTAPIAVGGPRLEGDAWMAVGAPSREVLPREFVGTLHVVIKHVLHSNEVTVFAFVA